MTIKAYKSGESLDDARRYVGFMRVAFLEHAQAVVNHDTQAERRTGGMLAVAGYGLFEMVTGNHYINRSKLEEIFRKLVENETELNTLPVGYTPNTDPFLVGIGQEETMRSTLSLYGSVVRLPYLQGDIEAAIEELIDTTILRSSVH